MTIKTGNLQKWLFTLLVLCLGCNTQADDSRDMAAQIAAMEKFSFLEGHWQGEVTMHLADGSISSHRSTDTIRYLNNGTLLMIVGRKWAPGAASDAPPVSEHTALINYDERVDRYDLRSYFSGDFASGVVEHVDQDGARWMIEAGGVQMRFHILNDGPDSWQEKAEMSTDGGKTWTPTMDISFVRGS